MDGENANVNKIHCYRVLYLKETSDDEIVLSSASFLALDFLIWLVRSLFIPKTQ